MTSQDTARDRVVIPDTEEARSVADRFAKFLALGASQSTGVGAADALARDVEAYRIEQQNGFRSALPDISNQVGKRASVANHGTALGVDYGHDVSVTRSNQSPPDANAGPADGNSREQE